MQILVFVQALFDPRGRCNRKGLIAAAIALLTVEFAGSLALWSAGVALTHPIAIAFKGLLVYQMLVAATLRLHDVGCSGWRIAGFALVLVVWSLAVAIAAANTYTMAELQIGQPGFVVIFAAVCVPMAGALLWLHFAPGQAQTNRYGPVPDGMGFSRHVDRNRAVPAGVSAAA